MKGLTLTQPWATLVALGAKKYETRIWSTQHRGLIAIHSAKAFPTEARALCYEEPFLSALCGAIEEDLPLGSIIATASVICCHHAESLVPTEKERAFGDFAAGRWAWQLVDVVELDKPIPCRGALGLWTVPEDIAERVMIARARS